MQERDAYIALNMMDKVGPIGVRRLVEVLGSAAAIFSAPRRTLVAVNGVGPDTAGAIERQRDTIDIETEVEAAAQLGARLVTPLDKEYPAALGEIHDPPLALYVRGRFESRDKRAVAVVGTRRLTMYGRDVTARMADGLTRSGVTVVSGLAEGIDAVAHEATLKASGRTIAVIGSGLDCLYPACHDELADRIAERGAVVSEFPLGRRPDRTTFPMRNRIVSGLSMGVLVVEAGARSGALITVRMALEQGRTVFAVPGRIDSPMSRGPNDLLKQGAQPVTQVDDMLESFEFLIPPRADEEQRRAPSRPELTTQEASIVALLEKGISGIDGVIRESGLSAADVGSALITLEMKRVVRSLPGRRVELAR